MSYWPGHFVLNELFAKYKTSLHKVSLISELHHIQNYYVTKCKESKRLDLMFKFSYMYLRDLECGNAC